MQSLEFEGWRIAFDAEATRRATARMGCGAAEACGCEGCLAFSERRAELLGPELEQLLARLGADPAREWEVEPLGKGRSGEREVAAAWRFIGRVLEEPTSHGRFAFWNEPSGAADLARFELRAAYRPPEPSPGR